MSNIEEAAARFVEAGGRVTRCGKYVFGIQGEELTQVLVGRAARRYLAVAVFLPRLKKRYKVPVHRIVAVLKYGTKSKDWTVVRHANDNPLDNSWENIVIGTISDNAHDRPEKHRALHAQIAGKTASRYTEDMWRKIREDYAVGLGYKKLRAKYGVPLGTLSYQLSPTNARRLRFLEKLKTQPNFPAGASAGTA